VVGTVVRWRNVVDRQVAVLVARRVESVEHLGDQLPSCGAQFAAYGANEFVETDQAVVILVKPCVQLPHLLWAQAKLAHRTTLGELGHIQLVATVAVADLEIPREPADSLCAALLELRLHPLHNLLGFLVIHPS